MSDTQLLRVLVNERLAAAAEEIFGLVEKTIVEYQDEVVRSKREIIQLRQQLNTMQPDMKLNKADPLQVSEVFPCLQQHSKLEQIPIQEDQVPTQIKEERVDLSIIPDLEAGTSDSLAIGFAQSEPVPGQLSEEIFSPKHDWSPILEKQQVQELLLPQVKEEVEERGVFQGLEGGPSVSMNCGPKQWEPANQYRPFLSDASLLNADHDEGWRTGGDAQLHLTPSSQSAIAPSCGQSVSSSHLNSLGWITDNHCVVCGKQFESQEVLIGHLQTHKDVRFCHICYSCFGRDIDLVRHVEEMHPGEKPFKCNVCGKVFGRREHLTMHSRTHTGEKPYQCPFCEKSFTQSAYLCVHKRTHTGEKPYCCTICGKRFYTSSALKSCMRYHTGEKSFRCQYCSKAFYTNTHLKVHIRVHTGSKPYHCPICHKLFAHKATVTNHMKTHNKTQRKHRRIEINTAE